MLLLVAVIVMIVFGSMSKKNEPNEDHPPVPDTSPIVIEYDMSEDKTESASAHDAAFYQARWQMIQEESEDSGLELNQVEKFVSEAGTKDPAEAVEALAELRAA